MVPVMTEAKHYKFVKKGGSLKEELVRLFSYVSQGRREECLSEWSLQAAEAIKAAVNK